MKDSARQREHYERLIETYERHYFDYWSLRYRHKFIYQSLWRNLDLNGKDVVELACGSGQNSQVLLQEFPSAKVTGLDISPTACAKYRSVTGSPALVVDLTKPSDQTMQYDAAFVVGGIHHCVADLPNTLKNIAGMLRPGGVFIMMEPNSRHLLEWVRRLWYKLDTNFDAETEHALDHDTLIEIGKPWFALKDIIYLGGPAYFFVLNSMIMRVPLWLKPVISPPLLGIETAWNAVPWPRMHNVFIARWMKMPNSQPDLDHIVER